MQVTVDRVGRIVIPKPLRDALGIGPDSRLEVVADGAGLRLDPVSGPNGRSSRATGCRSSGRYAGTTITDDDVRRLRDELQR